MEQARNYVCRSCASGVPTGHKFCGRCGEPVPPDILSARTLFFGDMQNPAKAKLILIRGEGMDGVSYHLNAAEHIAGRKSGAILFPEDNYLSPRHANFFYDEGRLHVRDEGALNGVFIRLKEPAVLEDGDVFLAGEELFRIELREIVGETTSADHTHFFASPRPAAAGRVVQVFEGGRTGIVHSPRDGAVTIGREQCNLNFPNDRFISGRHCRVDLSATTATVTDMQSRNGTYVRVKGQRELTHGDYLFVGRQLLRVEITAT